MDIFHLAKAQSASGQPAVDSYEHTYEYGGEKPNAPTQVGDRRYEYDANGNQSYWEDTTSKEYRQLLWDEENRLMAVDDNGYLSRYVYDHSGQRVVKAHGGLQGVYRNGAPVTPLQHAAKYTLYVSPYMTVTQDRFTKHYYAGTRRILSKNGTGVFNNMYRPGVAGVTAGGVNYFSRAAQIENAKNEYIKGLGIPPGPPTMKGIYAEPEYTGKGFPDGGTPVQDPPRGWPRKPVFNPPGGPPGPPIQWGDELTNEAVEPGFGYIGTGAIPENDQYFYHPDHLGSTAYVTNVTGAVCQFFVYLPYGEALVDKHTSPWKVPYTFSAKEQDVETKLTYFEARYYDAKYTEFLSVDPLWWKKPWISGYAYCFNSPVRFIDPLGLEEIPARKLDMKTYNPEQDVVMLNEISIVGKRPNWFQRTMRNIGRWILSFDEVNGGSHLYKRYGYNGREAIRSSGKNMDGIPLVDITGMDAMFHLPSNWFPSMGPWADGASAVSSAADAVGEFNTDKNTKPNNPNETPINPKTNVPVTNDKYEQVYYIKKSTGDTTTYTRVKNYPGDTSIYKKVTYY